MYFLQTGILMMISMQVDALITNMSGDPLNGLPIDDTNECQITGESNDNKKDHVVIVLDSSNEASPVKIDAQSTKILPIENADTLGVGTQNAGSESAVDEPVLPIPFKTPDNQVNVSSFGDSPQQVPTSVLKRNLLAIKMELQDREDEEVRACIQRTGSVQSDETEVFSGDEAVADSLNVD